MESAHLLVAELASSKASASARKGRSHKGSGKFTGGNVSQVIVLRQLI